MVKVCDVYDNIVAKIDDNLDDNVDISNFNHTNFDNINLNELHKRQKF